MYVYICCFQFFTLKIILFYFIWHIYILVFRKVCFIFLNVLCLFYVYICYMLYSFLNFAYIPLSKSLFDNWSTFLYIHYISLFSYQIVNSISAFPFDKNNHHTINYFPTVINLVTQIKIPTLFLKAFLWKFLYIFDELSI